MGFVSVGSYAVYKDVDFGTGVSGVSVREASAGGGGTLEFHLDKATGPLVSTVALPVTRGWQTWQTVTGTSTGATGKHDVYAVFEGSNSGIANVNWIQFQQRTAESEANDSRKGVCCKSEAVSLSSSEWNLWAY